MASGRLSVTSPTWPRFSVRIWVYDIDYCSYCQFIDGKRKKTLFILHENANYATIGSAFQNKSCNSIAPQGASMGTLLTIHSILRWIIVVVGFAAILNSLVGWARKSAFGKMDRGLASAFSGIMDLQVTLGLLIFLVTGFGGAGFPAFRIEHLTTMLIAAFVAHTPSIFKKAANRHAVAFYAVLGAMVLVVIGVARLPGGWSR
jgi:hypothetical protein